MIKGSDQDQLIELFTRLGIKIDEQYSNYICLVREAGRYSHSFYFNPDGSFSFDLIEEEGHDDS